MILLYPAIFLLLLCLKVSEGSRKWVDPHSMKSENVYRLPAEENFQLSANLRNPSGITEKEKVSQNSDAYYRRIVRLLLNNAHLGMDPDFGTFSGHLNLRFNAKDHDFLKKFAINENANSNDFEEVQMILEAAFQKTLKERVVDMTLSVRDYFYLIFINKTAAVLVLSVLMMFVYYKLLRGNVTWRSIVKYFLLSMYLFDFAITFLYLFEMEEIEHMVNSKKHGGVPPECNPKNMNWVNYLWFLYNDGHCKEYHKANYRTLLYAVTPLKVLSHQFGTFIIGPLTHLGTGLGKFASSMFASMPFGLGFILFPIMLFTVCIVICIFLIFITQSFVKIRIFPFITFELGGGGRGRVVEQQVESNRTAHDFNRIEDVPRNRLHNRSVSNRKKNNVKNKKEVEKAVCNVSSSSSADSTPDKKVSVVQKSKPEKDKNESDKSKPDKKKNEIDKYKPDLDKNKFDLMANEAKKCDKKESEN